MKKIVRNISIIIGTYIAVGVVLPIIFKYAIFESMSYSNLSNSEWASFLGSYVGGILGGLGTLIAVFITVKDSKETQIKNEKDTNQRIDDDRNERMHERDEDKKQAERKEKNRFTNEIAEYIGKYITHISKYYYANMHAEIANDDYLKARQNLTNIEGEIDSLNTKISDTDTDSEKFMELELNKEHLSDKKEKLQRDYEEKRYEYNRNREIGDRTIANECFFIINTMLHEINSAKELCEKLHYIQKNSSTAVDYKSFQDKWLEKSTDELMELYSNFKTDYISEK